jgi:5-methylcytosine-specific restriction endonuclease McrA
MQALIAKLERTRFAATSRPGQVRKTAAGSRHVPAHVKRSVWQRDGGQCTFVSESGRRCEARRGLEFDHVKEYARGGEATVDGIRLRCRGHNQYTAEQTFGAGFMRHKRETAASARAARDRTANPGGVEVKEKGRPLDPSDEDVLRALRTLGYRAGESRRALELCADIPNASREDKLRRALTYFPQRCHRVETRWMSADASTRAPA